MQRNNNNNPSNSHRVLSSGFAAAIELSLFHPLDTVSKRLQNSKQKSYAPGQPTVESARALSKVIFGDAYDQGISKKIRSLYRGLEFASVYKFTQTIIRFSGQPVIRDHLESHYKETYERHVNRKHAKTMIEATAGGMIGLIEAVLVPVDNLKIKYQNNKAHFQNKGIFEVIRNEGIHLYNGTLTTIMRNVPASFILFGSSSWIKQHVLGLENFSNATVGQNILASSMAASTVVVSTHPIDTVKTRVQSLTGRVSTFAILKDLIAKEGPVAFFKGVTPKLAIVVPKTTLTMTIAQSLPHWLAGLFSKQQVQVAPKEQEESNFAPFASCRKR